MHTEQSHLPDRVAFIADTHLGLPDDQPERIEKVASFLRWLRGKVSHLYIVGDMFDFWFEYRHVVPNIAPQVVFELYNLVQDGTVVTIFAGNHDYWFGDYIQKSVGLTVVKDDLAVEHQGLKLYLHHGDGLYPDDNGYRILKKILRNKVSIFFFSLLHPDLARWIAKMTSKTSRSYFAPPSKKTEQYSAIFRDAAKSRYSEGFAAAVYGHCHIPLLEPNEDGTLVLLGDWIVHDTYVFLENGTFTLESWKPNV